MQASTSSISSRGMLWHQQLVLLLIATICAAGAKAGVTAPARRLQQASGPLNAYGPALAGLMGGQPYGPSPQIAMDNDGEHFAWQSMFGLDSGYQKHFNLRQTFIAKSEKGL